jgi:hypothetical protein
MEDRRHGYKWPSRECTQIGRIARRLSGSSCHLSRRSEGDTDIDWSDRNDRTKDEKNIVCGA